MFQKFRKIVKKGWLSPRGSNFTTKYQNIDQFYLLGRKFRQTLLFLIYRHSILKNQMDNEIKINSSLGNTKVLNDSKIEKRDHLEYLSVDSRGRKSSNCKAIIEKDCNSSCKICTKLEKSKCTSCHNGNYQISITNTCRECNNNCLDCFNYSSCLKCFEPFIKF